MAIAVVNPIILSFSQKILKEIIVTKLNHCQNSCRLKNVTFNQNRSESSESNAKGLNFLQKAGKSIPLICSISLKNIVKKFLEQHF